MKKTRPQRCSECGAFANERMARRRPMECFEAHPEAALIEWRTGYGLANAYWMICTMSRQGIDLDRFIEDSPAAAHTGATKAELTRALAYARKWKLPEFNASGQPLEERPITLFGRRTGEAS